MPGELSSLSLRSYYMQVYKVRKIVNKILKQISDLENEIELEVQGRSLVLKATERPRAHWEEAFAKGENTDFDVEHQEWTTFTIDFDEEEWKWE